MREKNWFWNFIPNQKQNRKQKNTNLIVVGWLVWICFVPFFFGKKIKWGKITQRQNRIHTSTHIHIEKLEREKANKCCCSTGWIKFFQMFFFVKCMDKLCPLHNYRITSLTIHVFLLECLMDFIYCNVAEFSVLLT